MRKSEIFEQFTKIAQDKGLISSDKSFKTLEETSRADSLGIDDIEKLYQVRPNTPKDMDYEKNIMEIAHPTSVISGPAYDKLNALVENNIERQNILLHIVNKRNDGLLTQRKYAQKELILSLVRIANDLDNKNKEELRVLADSCLEKAQNAQITKQAFPWLIAAVAATLGGVYLQQHLNKFNLGYERNYQYLTKEVDDLINSSKSWGVGKDLDPQFKDMMSQFRQKLDDFNNLYEKIKPNIIKIQTPRTRDELIELAKSPDSDLLIKSYRTMRAMADNMLPYVQKIASNFESETYKQMQTKDTGWMQSLLDDTQILHGGKGFISDDFDDVKRGIPAYLQSIKDLLNILKGADSLEKQAQRELQSAVGSSPSLLGEAPDFSRLDQTSPDYKPSAPPAPEPTGPTTEDLSRQLLQ